MDSDKNNLWDEDSQYIQDLVNRFEDMLKNNKFSYFDIDELNCLIEYYIDNDDVKKSISLPILPLTSIQTTQ